MIDSSKIAYASYIGPFYGPSSSVAVLAPVSLWRPSLKAHVRYKLRDITFTSLHTFLYLGVTTEVVVLSISGDRRRTVDEVWG